MTNYEKICLLLNAGHLVQAERNRNYIIFSSIMKDWGFRHSSLWTSLDICYDDLWSYWDEEEDINSRILTDIKVYQKPLRYPKLGDIVTVLPSVLDSPELRDEDWEIKEMIGWAHELSTPFSDSCFVLNSKTKNIVILDYRVLAPYVPD